MKLKHFASAAVTALVMASTPAHAGFVTATFSNVNPGQVVTIHSPTETGWAGVYNFTNASGDLTGNLKTFCIDIGQNIYGNQTVTFAVKNLADAPTPGSAMGDVKADRIRELWGRDYASIDSNVKAAAFQIAIWEIINESGSDLNIRTGSFYVDGVSDTTLTQAQTWLTELNGKGPKAQGLIALTSATAQDYVVQGPTVPVPPSVILAGIGAVCLLLPSVWHRRKFFYFRAAS